MINRDIYSNAMTLLAQPIDNGDNNDFEERAPYILANFCREAFELDKNLRIMSGLSVQNKFSKIILELDSDFPLLDRFATVAAMYLAAMIIIDEDRELSDRLYDMYCDAMATLQCQIPSVIEKITDKYK